MKVCVPRINDATSEPSTGARVKVREYRRERFNLRVYHCPGWLPPSLLDSQFAALEALQEDEFGITIDIDQPPSQIVESIARFQKP